MSRYIVRVVGPAGAERYLSRGREVERGHAKHYPHPSNAYDAAMNYWMKHPLLIFDVIDTRDPERQVPA